MTTNPTTLLVLAAVVLVALYFKGYLRLPAKPADASTIDELGKKWAAAIKAKVEEEIADLISRDAQKQVRDRLMTPFGGAGADPGPVTEKQTPQPGA